MTTVAEAFVTLRPDTKGFTQEAQTGVGSSMKKLAAGAGAAFAAVKVKDFLGGAIAEARESNKVAAQTAQVIKSTGGVANVTAKDFDNLASSISKKAGIDDEAIQSAENLLATFTNVRNETGKGNKVFDQATQAIVDMSAVQGDLQGNSILVGKALQDPIKGVTALQRVGVKLSDQQKQQVKDFVAAGDAASAQKVILKELGVEFGGQAAAQATSADKLKVAWGNLQETVGKKLIPIFEKVSSFLVEHQALIGPLAVIIGGVLVVAFTAWAVSATAAAVATIAAAAPVIGIIAVIAALAAGIYLLVKNWDEVWSKIKDIAAAAWGAIRSVVGGGVSWLVDTFKKIPGWIGDAMKGLANIITAPYRAAFNGIARAWNSTVGKIHFKLPGWIPGLGGKSFDVPNIPTVGSFDLGGVVPGPLGRAQLALVHSGETILPTHKRGFAGGPTFSIGELVVQTNDDPQRIRMTVNQSLRDAAWQMGYG